MTMPERTCIGCKRKGEQSSFLRVSRESGGRVVLFENGLGRVGRSAYFCPDGECIELGMSKERLARALKCVLSEAEKAELKQVLVCKLR